ncbi:recombinase family protein [Streptomyces sp. NPDC050095]|uniref:recombinase family protein n=1 Tax=unclassified Streptomyces TaxID=2593676 RepID=UPI0034286F34
MGQVRLLGALRESKLREHSDSFEGQENDVLHVVAGASARLVEMTRDRDVSGREVRIFERPKLGPWFKKPDRWDGIAVQKIDRLTRRPVDIYLFLEWLTKHGKFLVSSQGDDTRTKSGRQRVELMAMVGSWEWEAIQERNQDSHERARFAGKFHGGRAPYGYTVTGEKGNYRLTVNEDEADVMRRIAAEVIEGRSYLSIARDLTADGIPSPKAGKQWELQTVRALVKSPAIIGRKVHKGKEVIGDDGMPVQAADSLISFTTWTVLQRAVKDKAINAPSRKRSNQTPLLGVVLCAGCGKRMYRNPGRSVNHRPRYRCHNNHCDVHSIVEEEIWALLNAWFRLTASGVERRTLYVVHGVDNRPQIEELKQRLRRLRDAREDGDWDDDLDGYRARRTKLRGMVAELEAHPVIPDREVWEPTGETYLSFWQRATDAEKGEECRALGITVFVDTRIVGHGRVRLESPSQWEMFSALEQRAAA